LSESSASALLVPQQPVAKAEEAVASWRGFLESSPPEIPVTIRDKFEVNITGGDAYYSPKAKSIQMYCDSPECEALMWWDLTSGNLQTKKAQLNSALLWYKCRHCGKSYKTFSVRFFPQSDNSAEAYKIGEFPPFGPHTPARVVTLIGPDRDLFLKGRRAEIRGLGIGAFAYYRRVVENQKSRILDEIAKVAAKVGAKPEVLTMLAAAKKENQFSTAIEMVKSGLPESLLIDGHNPLTLLHTALSRGLHEQDDAVCLGLAQSIRIVLAELAERMGEALKEEAELKSAVSKILQSNSRA
jgi:hypothetical protein